MIFADLDLARRLERPEAVAGARYVEALGRLSPDVGARWIEVAGAYAMFAGPASPVTQTFGLGLFAEPTAADLDQLETFFQERGAPVCHEVSPLAGLLVADLLSQRGYRPVEFTSVMYKPLMPPMVRLAHPTLACERGSWSRVNRNFGRRSPPADGPSILSGPSSWSAVGRWWLQPMVCLVFSH
jgi:hypothetical protein